MWMSIYDLTGEFHDLGAQPRHRLKVREDLPDAVVPLLLQPAGREARVKLRSLWVKSLIFFSFSAEAG